MNSTKREDAASILTRILEECKVFSGGSFPSLNLRPTAEGYQLHISLPLNEETRKCVDNLLRKYNVSLEEAGEENNSASKR